MTERGRRAQELRERRDGYPGLPVPNSPYDLCGRKAKQLERPSVVVTELWRCVKEEVDVLGSPCLTVCTVSVDAKQH